MSGFFKGNKKVVIVVGVILVLILAALARYQVKANKGRATFQVTKADAVEAVFGIGTVTANKSFVLKVALASNVRDIFVREGDFVTKGAPLVRLEETPAFRAPFSGTVTSVAYKLGEAVTPQTTILSLVDMKDRYLLVSLEQQAIWIRPMERSL